MTKTTTYVDELIDSYSCPNDQEAQGKALKLLRAWHLALETKDLPTVQQMMHDKVVIELPFNESGKTEAGAYRVYEGIPACMAFWETAMKFEKEMHPFTDMDLTVSPDGARIFLEARGHVTMASGIDYRNRYVLRLDIEDGKVRRYREYYNPIVSAHAFGRPIAGQFMLETL